jgi:hypothetical protein
LNIEPGTLLHQQGLDSFERFPTLLNCQAHGLDEADEIFSVLLVEQLE